MKKPRQFLSDDRLSRIKEEAQASGYTFPMSEPDASRMRNWGKKTVDKLIDIGLVKRPELFTAGLSTRAQNIILNCNIESREHLILLIQKGFLTPGKVRNCGWSVFNELSVWCGLGKQIKPENVQLCPHCGKNILQK